MGRILYYIGILYSTSPLTPEHNRKCAVLGNAVAGLCVQKRGGIPAIPTKEAVLELSNFFYCPDKFFCS